MNICIVSGIFAPEPGGPATYAPKLASELVAIGHTVCVVTFSDASSAPEDSGYPFQIVRVKRGNRLFNRARFFFAARAPIRKSDCVYMLDHFAAGLPASLAARMCRKPYVVRMGGDYLWEQRYLESGAPPVSLQAFYDKGLNMKREYAPYASVIWRILSHATHIVFNADRLRDLYIQYWDVEPDRSSVIYNPVPEIPAAQGEGGTSKEFVFWGRFIVMKNVTTIVRAFAAAKLPEGYRLTLIGDGPRKREVEGLICELGIEKKVDVFPSMPLEQVLEKVRNARAFVLPSWTDISPNQVYEALAIGLPAIVTKENYLSVAKDLPITVDPNSVDDVKAAMENIAGDSAYQAFAERFRAIRFENSWKDVARAHEELFVSII